MDSSFASIEVHYSSTEMSVDPNGMEEISPPVVVYPQLPSDPNDEYYLTNCFVCQEVTKPGQKDQNPIFICRKGDSCVITIDNRRACQKCRYIRCLAAGMDSAAVLTDQQRLLRFRKVIEQKKFRKNLKVSKTERKRRTKAESSINQQKRLKEVKAASIVDNIILNSESPQLQEDEQHQPHQQYQQQQPHQQYQQLEPIQLEQKQDLQLHKLKNSTAALQRKIDTIVKCHEVTFTETDDFFFQKLDNISDGDLSFDISREDFLSYVKSESDNFRKFALLYKHFSWLSRETQNFVIARSTPLFIQLNLCIHFIQKLKSFHKFKELNSHLNLFRSDANLDEYEALVNQLKVLKGLGQPDQKAVLFYLILFDDHDSIPQCLVETELMNTIIFDVFIKLARDNYNLKDFIKILSELALFFTYNVNIDVDKWSLDVTYTVEEDSWLKNQIKLVDTALHSVSIGQELIHEFIMFSLDVPLSGTFLSGMSSVFLDRIYKVWYIHPEFKELPIKLQQNLTKRKNCLLPLALYVARCESLSGSEQIQECLSGIDKMFWNNSNMARIFDTPDKIVKVSIRNFLSTNKLKMFDELLSKSSLLIQNADFFKLNLLLALTQLTKPGELDAATQIFLSGLHFKYRTILRRKMKWKNDSFPVDSVEVFSRHDALTQLHDQYLKNSETI